MTQEELEKHAYAKELERIDAIFRDKGHLIAEKNQIEADMLIEHQNNLTSIRESEGRELQNIKDRFLTQEELSKQHYDAELDLIRSAYGDQTTVSAEQQELEANLLQEHQDRLKEIRGGNGYIEDLQSRFATESELEELRYETEIERLIEHLSTKKTLTAEDMSLMEKLEQEHSDKLTAIKNNEQRAQIRIAAGTMGAIASAFQSGNEKMQKVGKKFAIARAVLAGGQAAVDAWRSGMETSGPWAPLVAASYTAASLARTGSMISSIKGNSTPSKGGSVARPNVPSGSPGGSGNTGTAQNNQQNPDRRVYINIEGDSDFSGDRVLKLIGAMNEAVGEGVELISSNGG